MSGLFRIISVVLLATQISSVSASANGQINRTIEWQDTNQLNYETNTILRHDGLTLSPCVTADLFTRCLPSMSKLTIFNVIGRCQSDSQVPCIEKVEIRTPDQGWTAGLYSGERNAARSWLIWPKDYIQGIDVPRANNLYEFPGFKHSKGQYFEVSPVISAESNKGSALDYKNLRINVFPVFQELESGSANPKDCINMAEMLVSSTERCWRRNNESLDWELRVSLLLPKIPYGWATGRIADPSISIDQHSSSALPVRLRVSGKPMLVPMLNRSFLRDEPIDFDEWNKVSSIFNLPWDQISKGPVLGPNSINQFLALVESLPTFDRATGERLAWIIDFTWIPTFDPQSEITKCSRSAFIGYAGSNSLTFENAVPMYNVQTSTLNYSVASPHYRSTGEKASGIYQLIIDTKVSRCLWKLTSGVTSASISVVDIDGTSKSAITNMVERENFTYFSVAGFGFSKSTITVQLKASSPDPKVSATSSTKSQKSNFQKTEKKSKKKSNKKSSKKP